MSLTDKVKAHALSVGVDLIGVAPVDRFEGAPENFNPQTLLPQTKSVISIAIRHLRGVLVPQREFRELPISDIRIRLVEPYTIELGCF